MDVNGLRESRTGNLVNQMRATAVCFAEVEAKILPKQRESALESVTISTLKGGSPSLAGALVKRCEGSRSVFEDTGGDDGHADFS